MEYVSAYPELKPMEYRLPWSDCVTIKNQQSEVLSLSSSYASRLGFRNPVDALGITPYGMICPVVDIASHLVAQDRAALLEKKAKTYIALVMYASSEIKPRLTVRQPVDTYIVSNHRVLDSGLFAQYFYERIQLIDRGFHRKMQTSYEVVDAYAGFTLRETQVMYYLLLGMNSRLISHVLQLSPRTVQHYIENIKDKMGCNATSQLIELALYLGFNKQIPASLLG